MNIYEKLNKLQTEVSVGKENNNGYANFKYRTIDDIYTAIKPLLVSLKVVITTDDTLIPIGRDKEFKEGTIIEYHKEGKEIVKDTLNRKETEYESTLLKSTICFINVENPEEKIEKSLYVKPDYTRKGMSYEQMSGSAITYAHKYLLGSMLLLSDKDTEDIDAQDNTSLHFAKAPNRITKEQVEEIKSKVNEENIQKILDKFKKPSLDKLTQIEATQVFNQLNKGKSNE